MVSRNSFKKTVVYMFMFFCAETIVRRVLLRPIFAQIEISDSYGDLAWFCMIAVPFTLTLRVVMLGFRAVQWVNILKKVPQYWILIVLSTCISLALIAVSLRYCNSITQFIALTLSIIFMVFSSTWALGVVFAFMPGNY